MDELEQSRWQNLFDKHNIELKKRSDKVAEHLKSRKENNLIYKSV